jgi:hypothetical protein
MSSRDTRSDPCIRLHPSLTLVAAIVREDGTGAVLLLGGEQCSIGIDVCDGIRDLLARPHLADRLKPLR